MSWELQIFHIDVTSTGDATLIVAKKNSTTRSVLIDGGTGGSQKAVHDCIVRKAELTKLDVAICTHYDKDHMNGLTALLEFGSKVYDSTRIFDCGSITTDADNDVRNYNTAATSSSRVDRAAGCRLAFAHGSQHVRRRTSLRLKGG